MPTFHYEALNSAGQSVKAEVEAQALEEAIGKIRAQGYLPTKVRERMVRRAKSLAPAGEGTGGGAGGRKKWFNIHFGGLSTNAIANFTRELSTLQDAGLPILRSLKVLGQHQKPGLLKSTLDSVAGGVEGGATLSEALAQHPRAFDRLYVNMVQAGETGGVLDVILQRLAEFMEKAQRLRRRILGAMIYPTVVIAFSVLIVTGIMIFVVPKFQVIFHDFRTRLPSITLALMATSDFIANRFGWVLILGSPFILLLAAKLIAKNPAGRGLLDRLKLKLPIIGRIIGRTAIARFARTLGTLLSAGVPILDALKITRDTVGNAVFANALQKVHDAIREGESFAAPLRATRVCDVLVTNMIDVGEETGDLDKMLIKIADKYDEEVDVLVASLVSLLEPVMVVVLGGIVGTIVVALFMPLVILLDSMAGQTGAN